MESLEQQLESFRSKRFISIPLAGMIVWSLVGLAGWLLTPFQAVWVLFIGTGCIVYLGMFISKYTGEYLYVRSKKTMFDFLYLHVMLSTIFIFGIAIPFFLIDYTSLPLTVGILTGIAWLPASYLMKHWIGYFHSISRTLLIVAAWYLFPEQRFIAIPVVIVILYGISILVLERRWRSMQNA
jgi:hypothetical protein